MLGYGQIIFIYNDVIGSRENSEKIWAHSKWCCLLWFHLLIKASECVVNAWFDSTYTGHVVRGNTLFLSPSSIFTKLKMSLRMR